MFNREQEIVVNIFSPSPLSYTFTHMWLIGAISIPLMNSNCYCEVVLWKKLLCCKCLYVCESIIADSAFSMYIPDSYKEKHLRLTTVLRPHKVTRKKKKKKSIHILRKTCVADSSEEKGAGEQWKLPWGEQKRPGDQKGFKIYEHTEKQNKQHGAGENKATDAG